MSSARIMDKQGFPVPEDETAQAGCEPHQLLNCDPVSSRLVFVRLLNGHIRIFGQPLLSHIPPKIKKIMVFKFMFSDNNAMSECGYNFN